MIPEEFLEKTLFIMSHLDREDNQEVIGLLQHPEDGIIGIAFDGTIDIDDSPMINFVTNKSRITKQQTPISWRLVWRNTIGYERIEMREPESISSTEVEYVIPIDHPIIQKILLVLKMRDL